MKKLNLIITILFLILVNSWLTGQEWVKTVGGGGSGKPDYGYDIFPFDDGSALAIGTNRSTLAPPDSMVVQLVLFDQDGDKPWGEGIALPGFDHYVDAIQLSDGNYLLAQLSSNGSTLLSDRTSWLTKFDQYGEVIWSREYADSLTGNNFRKIFESPGGSIYIGGQKFTSSQDPQLSLLKLTSDGNPIYYNLYENPGNYRTFSDIIELSGGNLFMAFSENDIDDGYLAKLDFNGQFLWTNQLDSNRIYKMKTTPDENILAIIIKSDPLGNKFWLSKINTDGEIIWEKPITITPVPSFYEHLIFDVTFLNDDNYLLSGSYSDGNIFSHDGWLRKYNPDGEVIWERFFGDDSNTKIIFNSVCELPDGKIAATGTWSSPLSNVDFLVAKFDSIGYTSPLNSIIGQVFFDENETCFNDNGEPGLNDWHVRISGDGTGFNTTDSSGNYGFNLFNGNYELDLNLPGPYWQACENNFEIIFEDTLNFDTAVFDFAIGTTHECPYLNVDLTTPFLRRCFPSTYYVSYCNDGTLAADSVYVEIVLDTFLTYLSSSIPLASQSGDTLTFQLDTVDIGECGNFTFEVEVSCEAELGQAHCTEAHIFPDSLCVPTPSWSGAEIHVEGSCVNDTVFFNVQNIGNAPTSQTLAFLVIEDDVILFQGVLPVLEPQQVEEYHYAATGMTYRMEAEQEPSYPGGWSNPSATVEACGSGGFSFGFTNQFPQNDQSPFTDIDCRENIGSYDPNDKQGFPTGWGDEHFIEQNTDIEYLIRFQNTGTDTAFRVTIRDTLSPFLDPATVRPGASGHPYDFDLVGPGVLKFTFDDIELPDSSTNLAASQGFVKFRISQKPNVPFTSVIENSAAIYFDFNAPIITNTTFHTVGQDLLSAVFEVSPKNKSADIKVNVVPNPFSERTIIEIKEEMPGENTLTIFDITGKIYLSKNFQGSKTKIEETDLNRGIYIFHIKNENGKEVNGKMVVF